MWEYLRRLITVILLAVPAVAIGDDWPQWRGPHRDGVWRETGLLREFANETLPLKWQVPIGSGYCGPTVAAGCVFVMDRVEAREEGEPRECERILCFDEQSGREVWKLEYACPYDISYTAGPRASMTVSEGRAFALGATGKFHCVDTVSGKTLWKSDFRERFDIQMPIWGISAAPLLYEHLVIFHIGGRHGACVVALDQASGEEQWRALNDRASYSSPTLIEQGGKPVVVVWNADAIAGLSPVDGQVCWRLEFPPIKMPIGVPTPVIDGDLLFVSSFYDGSYMVRLSDAPIGGNKLWAARGRSERQTSALHCMISTPLMIDGYIYGVDSYGELRCLKALTGERIWENLTATPPARWSNIHMVRQFDRVWMFNERGELIIAKLSPEGFQEISRAKLIEPTTAQLKQRGGVCWSHPAFANRHVFARNDRLLVCASLADE